MSLQATQRKKVLAELERIRERNGGTLTARAVVDEARDPDHPLHHRFEWDDSVAAERWREDQAARLIRCTYIEMKIEDESLRVRAFSNLSSDRKSEPGTYRATADVLSDAEMSAQLLQDAMWELKAFRRKYATLKALAPVFAVIDSLPDVEIEAAERIAQ